MAEALLPVSPDEEMLQVVRALTGFPQWASLVERGVAADAAPGIVRDLVLSRLPEAGL